MRYRLDVVAPTVLDAVRFAGGWVVRPSDGRVGCHRPDPRRDEDVRPLEILGVEMRDLESVLASWAEPSAPADGRRRGGTVRRAMPGYASSVLNALDQGATEVTLWGERLPAELDDECRFGAAPS